MSWQEKNLHELLACNTPTEVFRELQNETRRMGLQSVSWVAKFPLPVDNGNIVTFDNYPAEWRTKYFDQGYLSVDPTIRHGMTSMQPLEWTSTLKDAPEFWEDAKAHGLGVGIAQSMWDRHGCCSMLSLSRDSLDFSQSELMEKLPKISYLAQLAHAGMMRLILPREVPESAANLTAREKEVLKLTANALTAQQIADRLKLERRTVEYHLANARAKLGADNSTMAVVIAVKLGLV